MARRVPESPASKLWRHEAQRLLAGELWDMPDASELDRAVHSRMFGLVAERYGERTSSALERYARECTSDPSLPHAWSVVWCARWARCRQVYRISDLVANEILEQDIEGDVPVEALERLPFPIVYVDCGIDCQVSSQSARSRGFLAWLDSSPYGARELCACYFFDEDGVTSTKSFDLVGSTLSDMVRNNVESTMRAMKRLGVSDEKVERTGTREYRDGLASQMRQTINLLLYIISEDDDASVTYRPPSGGRGQTTGPRTNMETHHLLGARMGRAIGSAKSACLTGAEFSPTGRSMVPHVRKAHWQHYWVGPRKGRDDGRFGDKLILKWLPPIFVNGLGEPVEVVHESRA